MRAAPDTPAEGIEMAGRLARLHYKYETLGALRRARAAGEPIPERRVFRALAAEFPGALFELDRLPLDEIDARRDALELAARGGPAAPWMSAMADYHALYRAALYIKARAGKGAPLGDLEATDLAAAAARHASIDVGPAFARSVARPEGGRIGPVVLAEAARRARVSPRDLGRELFPARRDFTGPEDIQ